MALDNEGRPIPVGYTEQPDLSGQPTEEQKQFALMAEKADNALRIGVEIAHRMVALEKSIGDRFDEKFAEFEGRFNELMVNRLREFQKQMDTMVAAYGHRQAPQPLELEHDSDQSH